MKSVTLTPEGFECFWCITIILVSSLPLDDQELTQENIQEIFTKADIRKPGWEKIARELGFQLQGQYSVNSFLKGWDTIAHMSELSWGNLASALNKIPEYKLLMGMMQSKAGMECTLCVLMFHGNL